MLAGHGLLAAIDSISSLRAGSLSGPERGGSELYWGLVLALLASVAGPQSTGQRSTDAVGLAERLGAYPMALPLRRGLGGNRVCPRAAASGFSGIFGGFAISLVAADPGFGGNGGIWYFVSDGVVIGFVVLCRSLGAHRQRAPSFVDGSAPSATGGFSWGSELWES